MAWDWQVFCKETTSGDIIAGCFGKGGDVTYLDWLMSAWGWTLAVAMCAMVVAFVMGFIMGTLRTLPDNTTANRWLIRLGTAWTELFRNIPILVQLFIWYFVLPAIFPRSKLSLHLFWSFSVWAFSPRHVLVNKFGLAFKLCQKGNVTLHWQWGSRHFKVINWFCYRWHFVWSCRH